MNKSVQWRDGAASVYLKEYLRYEAIRDGLGSDFEMQVEVAQGLIQAHPQLWTAVSKNVRRILVKRFPFIMYFKVHKGWIEVIGFRHAVMRQGKYLRRK